MNTEQRLDPRLDPQECDLVMKGGVTSGVVYPPAILELAKKYRFKSIGGASAGAIAAAAAAAAEYGRQTGAVGDRAGFKGLARMKTELEEPGFLRGLFQAAGEKGELLDSLEKLPRALSRWTAKKPDGFLDFFRLFISEQWNWLPGSILDGGHSKGKRRGACGAILVSSLLLGVGTGAAGGVPTAPWLIGWGLVSLLLLAVCTWLAGKLGKAFAGVRWLLQTASSAVTAQSHFGLCSGSGTGDGRRALSLTEWLSARINELAGLSPEGPPLTFKDLTSKGITLRMVTTNLTLGQPFLLPMQRGARSWFFRLSDFRGLFPSPVTSAMIDWSNQQVSQLVKTDPQGNIFRLPFGEDLPVVVATRMSLSFPFLLQAIPVYSMRGDLYKDAEANKIPKELEKTRLDVNWWSDGGVCSNFPVHIFDTWIPQRPTFGITLYDSPTPDVFNQRQVLDKVVLPLPVDFDKARPSRVEIDGPFDFFRALLDAAMSHRDNAQASLPSYRERIAQVYLDSTEGGLNLNMDSEVIQKLGQRGAKAGLLLIEHFSSGQKTSYAEHVWVRLRVLLARLEQELAAFHESGDSKWRESAESLFAEVVGRQLAARSAGGVRKWYRDQDDEWCIEASHRFGALLDFVAAWKDQHTAWCGRRSEDPAKVRFFARNPPRPQATLRVTPEL
jgi:predicted acylesterase/phospholipase RssA